MGRVYRCLWHCVELVLGGVVLVFARCLRMNSVRAHSIQSA